MLIVGYRYGLRSERRLTQEVELHLAYRWFCRSISTTRFLITLLFRLGEPVMGHAILERVLLFGPISGLHQGQRP
jgi:transposase